MAKSNPVLILDGGNFTALGSDIWKATQSPGSIIVLSIFTDGTKHLMKHSSHVPKDSYFIYLGYKHPKEKKFRNPEEKFIDCAAFNKRYSQLGICWDDLNEVILSDDPMGKEIVIN